MLDLAQLRNCVFAIVVSASSIVNAASAQSAMVIPSAVDCRGCRIMLSRIVTLGSASDPTSPTDFQVGVTRDSRGRYYLAPTADYTTIAMYGSDGRFIKTIGRSGKGPGEYGFIMRADVTSADSIIVLDVLHGRMTVLSPGHVPVRAVQMHGRYTKALTFADGSLLVHGDVRSPDAAGLPLHLLAPDGRILRSFGSVTPETHRDRPQADLRQVTKAGAREVWTARLDRYDIERWNLNGVRMRSIRRAADWFKPWDYSKRLAADARPRPMTVEIWQDSAGLLWTMVRVPSSNWHPPPQTSPSREQPVPSFDVKDANFDTVVEVLDPSTGKLLGSQRYSQYFIGHIDDDVIYSLRSTEDGDLRIDVWRARLTMNPKEEQ